MTSIERERNNIVIGKRYFVKMLPLRISPIGWIYTSSTDREKWVECEIYQIKHNHKVILKAIEPGYGTEEFYICDFEGMVKSERHIIEKTREDQHVELIEWETPLTPFLNIRHSAYVVV